MFDLTEEAIRLLDGRPAVLHSVEISEIFTLRAWVTVVS